MTTPPLVTLAVEGKADVGVARAVLRAAGLDASGPPYVMGGNGNLNRQLAAYCSAATLAPWFVLRDMDHDARCAGDLVEQLAPKQPPLMCFRLAVRAAESWLLADRDALARELRVSKAIIPARPDELPDPKAALVGLARRSRSRDVRADLVPRDGSTARVGPGYVARVNAFAESSWRPAAAAAASPSLERCLAALSKLRKAL